MVAENEYRAQVGSGYATAEASYALEDQLLMARATNYFAWQGRVMTRELGRRVVEIGCGAGNFTGILLRERAVLAVDKEPGCIEQLRSRHGAVPQLQLLTCDWETPDWERELLPHLKAFRPDSCVCLNVLEHIEDDAEALRRMAAILPDGGVIVLMVPAFPFLYGEIDRRLGHYRRYTRESVRRLVDAVGLRVARLHYMNAIGFFGWWANAHVFKREAQSAAQIGVFDRYVVPLSSRMEKLIAPPFGQSLVMTLRR
jgi:SAM-dependent methyltransferase